MRAGRPDISFTSSHHARIKNHSKRANRHADANPRQSREANAQGPLRRARRREAAARIEDRLMLRPAVPADLARLLEIRDGSGADALSDPTLVGEADLISLINAGAVSVWLNDGRVVGFAATNAGTIHLLVASAHRGRGAGRELLAAACTELRKTG